MTSGRAPTDARWRRRLSPFALVSAAVAVVVIVSAAKSTHDFFEYVDRSIHVTVDDGEAEIGYALATEGRYGFFSSPVLVGMDRIRGQFNYGPWYFYLSAGLIWLFGFSLTLLRAIHLWVVLGSIGVAWLWFGGRARPIAAGVFSLGLLYCFEISHWPMVRPDIMVTAFAVAFVIAAGAAWARGQAGWWMAAALFATCSAFSHLIAAAVLPAAGVAWLLSAVEDVRSGSPTRWRLVGASAAAFTAGVLVALFSFYASFGFRFADQMEFFSAYRSLTTSAATPREVMGYHLTYAFGYLSNAAQMLVGAVLIVSWIVSGAAFWFDAPRRRQIQAHLLPPLLAWTAYGASNVAYQNYHQGYAILHQVMFLWTAAALVWVAFTHVPLPRAWSRRAGATVYAMAALVLLWQGSEFIAWQFSPASWKKERVSTWVAFADYSERVLSVIPRKAIAWGSLVFGMEAPGRIQLVQWSDAITLMAQVPPENRPELHPDFVIFGYAEARDNFLSVMKGAETLLDVTSQRVSGAPMRLVSLVAAAPYGVSRTYALTNGAPAAAARPIAAAYDAAQRRWLTRLAAPVAADFADVSPVALRIGYEREPAEVVPSRSKVATLPAGAYLLDVGIQPGAGRNRGRLIAATSSSMLRQTMGEMGPDGDFAPYLASDRTVHLLIRHSGGPLYVSQFDGAPGASITSVSAQPLAGLLDPSEMPSRSTLLPPLSEWTATSTTQSRAEGDTLVIEGDDTLSGYQLMSPSIRARAGDLVTLHLPARVDAGAVCLGALDGTDGKWLAPADTRRTDVQFRVDATQGFRVVLANCKASADGIRSRFVVMPGQFEHEAEREFYADRLVAAALDKGTPKPEPIDATIKAFPPELQLTRSAITGPVTPITEWGYTASNVQAVESGWLISGLAAGQYTYVLQSKPVRIEPGGRLLAQGRVERGGVTIGLLRNNVWAGQVNVTDPGEFTVVVEAASRGEYSIVVANNLRDPAKLDTSVTLTTLGLLRR